MDNKNDDIHTRDEIEDDLLVADYVAGRLDDEARNRFEERLKDDDELLARFIEERGFRAQPTEAAVGDVEAVSPTSPDDEPAKRASPWRRSAIIATLVAAAVVVFYMERPGVTPDDRGEGAPSESDAPAAPGSGRVRVVFAPGTGALDRAELSASFDFEIVGDPEPGGAYIVETDGVLDNDELATWRNDPRIRSVEPIRAGAAP